MLFLVRGEVVFDLLVEVVVSVYGSGCGRGFGLWFVMNVDKAVGATWAVVVKACRLLLRTQ